MYIFLFSDDCLYIFYICTDNVDSWPKNKNICTRLFQECEAKVQSEKGEAEKGTAVDLPIPIITGAPGTGTPTETGAETESGAPNRPTTKPTSPPSTTVAQPSSRPTTKAPITAANSMIIDCPTIEPTMVVGNRIVSN